MRALVLLLLVTCSTSANRCQKFEAELQNQQWFKDRYDANPSRQRVGEGGKPYDIVLYFGSEPGRAAAALLRVLLRRALRFHDVRVARGPLPLAALDAHIRHSSDPSDSVAIAVAATWVSQGQSARSDGDGCHALSPGLPCRLAGTWLRVLSRGAAPARAALHVRPAARAGPRCARAAAYSRLATLRDCLFVREDASHENNTVPVYTVVPELESRDAAELQQLAGAAPPLHVERAARARLLRLLDDTDETVLFFDYEMWADRADVTAASREGPEPPVVFTAVAGDLDALSPLAFDAVSQFKPSPVDLRHVLELEEESRDIDEAACQWAAANPTHIRTWAPEPREYLLKLFTCADNGTTTSRDWARLNLIGSQLKSKTRRAALELVSVPVDCADPDALTAAVERVLSSWQRARLVGLVVPARPGDPARLVAAAAAAAARVPLLQSGGPPDAAEAGALAAALARLLSSQGWRRLAVLSEPTSFATDVLRSLAVGGDLVLEEVSIPSELTPAKANMTLRHLASVDARIVFVNAASEVADVVLAAASQSDPPADDLVWIVREWLPTVAAEETVTRFVVTRWRNTSSLGALEESDRLNYYASFPSWPAETLAFATAVMTLGTAFDRLLRQRTLDTNELRGDEVYRNFTDILRTEARRAGVSGLLRLEGRALDPPTVRIDEWRDGTLTRTLLEQCAAPAAGACDVRAHFPAGAARCLLRAGRAFEPACYDWALVSGVLLLATAAAVLAAFELKRLRNLKRGSRTRGSVPLPHPHSSCLPAH